jgi:hypothetical protein
LWTAAFFQPITADEDRTITSGALTRHLAGQQLDLRVLGHASEIAYRQRFFHWPVEFPEAMSEKGFDVLLANPPYDVIRQNRFLRSGPARGTSNLYGHFVSRCVDILSPGGALGLVIPLSFACGDEFEELRRKVYRNFGTIKVSHYSIRPARLFPEVDQRITLLVALVRGRSPCEVFSTRLHRWNPGQQDKVLRGAEFGLVGWYESGFIPKVAGPMGAAIYKKIALHRSSVGDWLAAEDRPAVTVYYHAIARYWIKAYSFLPFFQREGEGPGTSTNIRTLKMQDQRTAFRFLCLANSSLFYYWWLAQSDEFHVLDSEIVGLPVPDDAGPWPADALLEQLVGELMASYLAHAVRRQRRFRGRLVNYDEFRPRLSLKPIQAIDALVNPLYGLTELESSFLAAYDMEFRTHDDE